MCTYRSLFTFINFKLLQRSLKEIERMNYDLTASNADQTDVSQQIELDIEQYKEIFAEDYCRHLKTDLEG